MKQNISLGYQDNETPLLTYKHINWFGASYFGSIDHLI